MTRSRFSQTANAVNKKSSGAIAIAQLVILGIVITLLAAIFVQNLQPEVQIFFLGQKTIAIPLSVAMLAAFVGGGFLAFVINAIASWRHNLLIRRAVIASGSGQEKNRSKPIHLSTKKNLLRMKKNLRKRKKSMMMKRKNTKMMILIPFPMAIAQI